MSEHVAIEIIDLSNNDLFNNDLSNNDISNDLSNNDLSNVKIKANIARKMSVFKKIQHFITKVIDESEIPPIIIIQGDHGLKVEMEDEDNPTDKELKERFSILNAYYIPTKNESLEQNITPVNSFRIIINELFNEQLEMLPNTNYWPVHEPPYIKEVTHILQENKMN